MGYHAAQEVIVVHPQVEHPAYARRIGVDSAGGLPLLPQTLDVLLHMGDAVRHVAAAVGPVAPQRELDGMVFVLFQALAHDRRCFVADGLLARKLPLVVLW